MRLSRFSLLAALLVGAVGCKEADLSPVTAEIPPLAFVRYINAVPDTNNTIVRWVDQVEFTPQTFVNVPFRGMGQGGYQGLQAGARRLKVFTYDANLNSSTNGLGATTAELADTTFTFVAGKYYTLLHLGYARSGSTPKQRVLIIEDQLPAASTSVAVRGIHAGLGLPAVDVYTASSVAAPLSGSPLFPNVGLTNGTAGISAYATRTAGAFAVQATAVGATASLISEVAPTGVAGDLTADPIAGATIAGSVMTAVAFPAPVKGSKAAGATITVVSGRVVDSLITLASGYDVRDSVAASWAANRFAATTNSSWTLTLTPPACPSVTAPSTIKCETRPGARTVAITGNTAQLLTVAADTGAIFRRKSYYMDTVQTVVSSGRLVDTVFAVTGGYEVQDSVAVPWTANRYVPTADSLWALTLTPAPCPTVTAPTTIKCATRPTAKIAKVTANGTRTLTTDVDLSAFVQPYYYDTVTTPTASPATQIVRSARTQLTLTRNLPRKPLRSTYSIVGTNPPSIVFFLDRQPARTTP